jgi:hypothetical protein
MLGCKELFARLRCNHTDTQPWPWHCLSFPGIGILTLLSFMEFLLDSNLGVPTVKNYISSVKSAFKAASVSIEVFASPQLALALSSSARHGVLKFPLNQY